METDHISLSKGCWTYEVREQLFYTFSVFTTAHFTRRKWTWIYGSRDPICTNSISPLLNTSHEVGDRCNPPQVLSTHGSFLEASQTLLQHPQQLTLPPLPTPTPLNRISTNPSPLLHTKVKRLLHGAVVAEYIAPHPIHLLPALLIHMRRRNPKIRRVVRVDTKPYPSLEILPDRERGDPRRRAQRQVRDWTNRNQRL